jgi:hypothetical protein
MVLPHVVRGQDCWGDEEAWLHAFGMFDLIDFVSDLGSYRDYTFIGTQNASMISKGAYVDKERIAWPVGG